MYDNSFSGVLNPFERHNADGTTELFITAHGALTALTPYAVFPCETGFETAAVVDNGGMYRIGVPKVAIASGATGWVVVGGPVDDMVTPAITVTAAGHFLKMDNALVADADATWSAAVFAVARSTGSSATAYDVFLINREVTGED